MKQGIIIAGFTALGKTTLAQKYDIVLTSMHWKLVEYFRFRVKFISMEV